MTVTELFKPSASMMGCSGLGRSVNKPSSFDTTSSALAFLSQTNCTSRSERSGALSSVGRIFSTTAKCACVPEMMSEFARASTATFAAFCAAAPLPARRETFCSNCSIISETSFAFPFSSL